jgi:hypothetical protein
MEERLGELDGARECYDAATTAFPGFRAARDRLERIFHQQGDAQGLRSYYAEELQRAKTAARRRFLLSILSRIYADLEPYDPEGVLRHEWVNARGAIARFERGALEIRVLDTSECPRVDVAIAAGAIALVSALACDELAAQAEQRGFATERLAAIFVDVARDAERAVLRDAGYLRALGRASGHACTAGELWSELLDGPLAALLVAEHRTLLAALATRGCLATRIRARAGADPDRAALRALYAELCECLARGVPFELDA